MRRCREAGADHIDVWGTGSASREFLYVDDAAEGIVLGAERYDDPDPVNLGVGREITIRDLVELIVSSPGSKVRSAGTHEARRPAAPCSRHVAGARAVRLRGGHIFEEGLRRTIEWYEGTTEPHTRILSREEVAA